MWPSSSAARARFPSRLQPPTTNHQPEQRPVHVFRPLRSHAVLNASVALCRIARRRDHADAGIGWKECVDEIHARRCVMIVLKMELASKTQCAIRRRRSRAAEWRQGHAAFPRAAALRCGSASTRSGGHQARAPRLPTPHARTARLPQVRSSCRHHDRSAR